MGLFDLFKKKKAEDLEDDDFYKDDWQPERPHPQPRQQAAPPEPQDVSQSQPEPRQEVPPEPEREKPFVPKVSYGGPIDKPEGWPVMEPISISERVVQFMQEHDAEEIELAASNAATEGMKAFQKKDFDRACGFFQLGSELGNAKAQALLGSMYIQGYQVPRDLAVGRAWLRRAAEQGNEQASEMLAKYVGESEPIAEELYQESQKCMKTNRPNGMYYLLRAADMGFSRAQYEYGMILIREEEDEVKGIEWVKRAAFGGYARAMTYLGNAYLKGELVPQSTSIALEWFDQAVKKKDPEAQLALGALYANGTAAQPDPDAAVRLLTQAADAGLSEAKELLEALQGNASETE